MEELLSNLAALSQKWKKLSDKKYKLAKESTVDYIHYKELEAEAETLYCCAIEIEKLLK